MSRWRIHASACLVVLLSACPGDDAEPPPSFATLVEQYRPTMFHPMTFGNQLDLVGYAAGFGVPRAAILTELAVAEDVGLDAIRVDLSYDAWLYQDDPSAGLFYSPAWDDVIRERMGDQSLREYAASRIAVFDAVVERVRADGRQLMLADTAAEQYWGRQQSHDGFAAAFRTRVSTLAARYQPDYYVVVKEPSWYMGKWGTSMLDPARASTRSWVELTQALCVDLASSSPSTRCAVAVSLDGYDDDVFSWREYVAEVAQLPDVDLIGFDVYSAADLDELESFLSTLDRNDKPLWILETWTRGEGSSGRRWMMQADAEWVTAVAYFAQGHGLRGFLPFYSVHSFTYASPRINDLSRQARNRTPFFYAYRDVIREVREGAVP